MRKFAIPFNGSEPNDFLKRLEPYKNNIDHVYIGLLSVLDSRRRVEWLGKNKNSSNDKKYNINESNYRVNFNDISQEDYELNCFNFLELSKHKYKRLLVLNGTLFSISSEHIDEYVITVLKPILEKFEIEGVIVAEFELAQSIRKFFPNIEIHLSVCSRINDVAMVRRWNDEIGISSFNIPLEFGRNIESIKRFKKLGIPIKMLVNESCICGCPMSITHYAYMSKLSNKNYKIYCDSSPLRNALQGSFVLPRHLKLFDDCVDIFKLSTRRTETNRLFKMIDYYVNERDDDTDVWEIIAGRMWKRLKSINRDNKNFHIPINKMSDKTVLCNCEDCRGCDICKKLMEKFFDDGGVSDLKSLI